MLMKRLYSAFSGHFPKSLATFAKTKRKTTVLPEEPKEFLREIEILKNPDYFQVHNLFTVKDLFKAKVHYGHKASTLHENMKPFVFGARLGHVIFDLDVTAYHLREALNFAAHIAYRDGIILFVSKNPRATLMVDRTAKECKEYALTRDFIMGTFTNSKKFFNTDVRLPDLVIVLNTLEENGFQHPVIAEACKMCIPIIGVVDSNANPNLITYPVPGNDDSYYSLQLYCKLFKKAILRGKLERQKDLENTPVCAEEEETARKESVHVAKSEDLSDYSSDDEGPYEEELDLSDEPSDVKQTS